MKLPSLRRGRGVDPGNLVALLILIVGAAAALSVDVVRTGFGIKGDEATYVAMALSVAYDGDLAYERRDLERFYEIYNRGPEGIFLKLGKRPSLRFGRAWPFVSFEALPSVESDRLYFGKAYIHAIAAAPFVRFAGLNGLLLFNVVLMICVLLAAYRFLSAHSPPGIALPYAMVFFGVSIVPLYTVWLTSEIFNVATVFLAYFFWFHKVAAPVPTGRLAGLTRGPLSDVAGAVLLALATFSKPSHLLLVAPPVLWLWWQRRFRAGLVVAAVFGIVVAGAFAINGLVTGDLNYQGGERRTYYGSFPFDSAGAGFADRGIPVSTTELVIAEPLTENGAGVLARNVSYFLFGRHFGFVPFFFPGVVTLVLAARARHLTRVWPGLILGAVLATAAVLVFYLPYTWSGGGGPSGNRYFLSVFPVLLFVTPPLQSLAPAVTAGLGGALFVAQILWNPFLSAKQPYVAPQHGALRWLPVELTMVNDLPIMLDPGRSRLRFGSDPTLLLYLLDENVWPPERPGIWIAGRSRAQIIVRTSEPLSTLTVRLEAPFANRVTLDAGGGSQTIDVEPNRPVTLALEGEGVRSAQSWAYLLTVRTTTGFVPRLTEPGSRDTRFLGVVITPSGQLVSAPPHGATEGDR